MTRRLRGAVAGLIVCAMVAAAWAVVLRSPGPQSPDAWSVQLKGASVYHTPGAFHYILCGDDALLGTGLWQHSRLIGFDGSDRWQFNPDNSADRMQSTAAMSIATDADGWIFVGTNKNSIYAYDAGQNLVWNEAIPDCGEGNPYIKLSVGDNGMVYATTQGRLHALDKAGNVLWTSRDDTVAPATAPVVGGNSRIYCGTPGQELCAFDGSGNLLWKTANGTVGLEKVIAAGDGTIVCPDDHDGLIQAFNPDGSLRWQVKAKAASFNQFEPWVVVGPDSSVYYTERTKRGLSALTALGADGTREWSKTFLRTAKYPIMLPDGRIAVIESGYYSPGNKHPVTETVGDLTQEWNAEVHVLDPGGGVVLSFELDFLSVLHNPLISRDGELLLIDLDGVLNAYAL